jgi:hypothetical protein
MTRYWYSQSSAKRQWAIRLTQEIDQENIASYVGENEILTLTRP